MKDDPERERAKNLAFGLLAIVAMLAILLWAWPAYQQFSRCQNLAPIERLVTRGC
jgi:hypothetical protein